MRALACLVFIALAYGIRGNPDLSERRVKNAPIGKFPYQVLLRYDGGYKDCGGSILNNRNILTSAGCLEVVKEKWDKLKAHVGTNFLAVPGDIYDVVNVTKHVNYAENDIALIHLETPIKYNKLVQPINFMTSDKDLVGNPCTLTGWVQTQTFNDDGFLSPLQEVELMVYELNTCRKLERRTNLTTKEFCAVTGEEEGKNFYYIGSPLVANGDQIGILKYSERPKLLNATEYQYHPRIKIFTRVSDYAGWISENLKND